MNRYRTVLINAVLIVAAVLFWRAGLEPAPDESGSVEAETASTPLSTNANDSAEGSEPPLLSAVTDSPEPSIDAQCDLAQLEKLQQFNRDNLRRLENSRLEPEAIAAYRGMSPLELKALFEQEDTLAMMVYGMYYLFAAMGRNPELAIDFLYYQMPIRDITPNPKGVPDDAKQYAREARRAFTEAAMRGRHSAFTFIGLTYDAEGKDAVDLFWLTEDAYETLTDKQKFNLAPRIVYSHLASRIDPNLLPHGSPNRKMFEKNFALLGDHGRFLNLLELQFKQRMDADGLIFPALPAMTYPDVEAGVIDACENDGYSQWD